MYKSSSTIPIPTLFPPCEQGLLRVSEHWFLTKDGDPCGRALYHRHYSRKRYADGRSPLLFIGPGEKMALVDGEGTAVFAWQKSKFSQNGQFGVNCTIFRNESPVLASLLIEEAVQVAWRRWPDERLYTYVNKDRVRSSNPGYCFIKAGFTRCGRTAGGLLIFERVSVVSPEIARAAGVKGGGDK